MTHPIARSSSAVNYLNMFLIFLGRYVSRLPNLYEKDRSILLSRLSASFSSSAIFLAGILIISPV